MRQKVKTRTIEPRIVKRTGNIAVTGNVIGAEGLIYKKRGTKLTETDTETETDTKIKQEAETVTGTEEGVNSRILISFFENLTRLRRNVFKTYHYSTGL